MLHDLTKSEYIDLTDLALTETSLLFKSWPVFIQIKSFCWRHIAHKMSIKGLIDISFNSAPGFLTNTTVTVDNSSIVAMGSVSSAASLGSPQSASIAYKI